ncbi:hypothetical protein BC830DRAFT_1093922 [Chytriomyces sp. MP71]|nr:hypothetical protein BC830DRAFT_1093922 [Chytriomyces sp. MP71]
MGIRMIPLLLFSAVAVRAFDWTLAGPLNAYTSLSCTLTVPPLPVKPATGDATYFFWPGLQTNTAAANYTPIGFGVLQPVLTFGPACTPNQPAGVSVYRGWHVSAQYVNPSGTVAGHTGCLGGNMMDVEPGDQLLMSMTLSGTQWIQTVVRQGVPCSGVGNGGNGPNGCQVSYTIDMMGQGQNRAELVLELYYQALVTSDVVFSNIQMTIQNPEPAGSTKFCNPSSRLQKFETCTGIVMSRDGKTCTIQQCLFAAQASPSTPPPAPSSGTVNGIGSDGTAISPEQVIPPPMDVPPPPTGNGGNTIVTSMPGNTGITSSNGITNSAATTLSPGSSSIESSAPNASSKGQSSSSGSSATSDDNGVGVTINNPAASKPASQSKTLIIAVAAIACVGLLAGGLVFYRRHQALKNSEPFAVDKILAIYSVEKGGNNSGEDTGAATKSRADLYAVAPVTASSGQSLTIESPDGLATPMIGGVYIPPRSNNSRTGVDSTTSFQNSTTRLLGDFTTSMNAESVRGGSRRGSMMDVQPSPLALASGGARRPSTTPLLAMPTGEISGRTSSANSRAKPVFSGSSREGSIVEIAERSTSRRSSADGGEGADGADLRKGSDKGRKSSASSVDIQTRSSSRKE